MDAKFVDEIYAQTDFQIKVDSYFSLQKVTSHSPVMVRSMKLQA
jgi:hypothetical protein